MTRDERQRSALKKWASNKCKGTFEFCTGFGKTTTAIKGIKAFLAKNPGTKVLVVVPTDYLKEQWMEKLLEEGLFMCVEVIIINSLIKKTNLINVAMLVIDEIHRMAAETFSQIFSIVDFKAVIGLTATLKRLDNRHTIIEQYCPVVDTITVEEAIEKKWLAKYVEYKVSIEVDDIAVYNDHNNKFIKYFGFFNNDFNLAMACAAGKRIKDKTTNKFKFIEGKVFREHYLKAICRSKDPEIIKKTRSIISVNAFGFIRELKARKEFVLNHPKKIEITNLILSHRLDKKAITFSPAIKVAEKIEYGSVLSSKGTKKKNRLTKEEFIDLDVGVLNTSKMLNEGADIPGINLLIILSNTSSSTEKTQRIGRGIRAEKKQPDKECEVFTLVLKNTVEESWFFNSNKDKNYITIDEENLEKVLKNEEFEQNRNKDMSAMFRF